MLKSEFLSKMPTPVAIVGMAKTGSSALALLEKSGLPLHEIATFDDKPGRAQYSNPEALLQDIKPKTLIVSPGVPLTKPWIVDFVRNGGFLTSEVEIAFSFLTTERVIGITGSIGKSTVTSLLECGLKSFSPRYFVGGNLGTPFADYITNLQQGHIQRAEWIVLELSSYQLDLFKNLRADFSVLTYLTPNHLERYASLNEYYDSKLSLIKKTTGACILNRNGGDLCSYLSKGSFSTKLIYTDAQDPDLQQYQLEACQMIGKHAVDNLALAAKVAKAAQWPDSAILAMKQFPGLSHRLENLGVYKGIRFVNDSKATTIESSLQAFHSLYEESQKGNIFFLLGGRDKNLPWENLKSLSAYPKSIFVFFGECGQLAQEKSQLPGARFAHLQEALQHCHCSASAGDTVLLSPGGTSLDEFKSFEDRGDYFKKEVLKLWSTATQQGSRG